MRSIFHVLSAYGILIVAGCGSAPLPPSEVGDVAPAFKLMNLGTQQELASDSLKGDVVVLNFWSTSCTVCAKEIDELKKIQSDGQAKVVGIAIDEDADQVDKVVKARGINYTVLHGNEEVFTKYDGFSIPYTLVLDAKLNIRKKIYGRMDKEEFDELVASIKSGS